jgi:Uma2 family endonuclease
MAIKPLKTGATYDDLREVPDHFVAEMLNGELYATPRPALAHTNAATALGAEIWNAFHRGRNGPGGWVILDEPELHFGNDVLVPDLAGWRRSRLPDVPAGPYLTLAPDWVCEVLSASTEALDRGKKLRAYARERVGHAWLLDPLRRRLEVLSLDSGAWTTLRTHGGGGKIGAEPFDALELELDVLWLSEAA